MTDLVFRKPGPDDRGFVRRMLRITELQEEIQSKPSSKTLRALIETLLDFVEQPADRDEARECMLDLSQNELNSLGELMKGGDANPTAAAPSETS